MSKADVFGRYQLGPLIARGGMGEVFHATQLGMGKFAKPLVLKLLMPHLGEDPHAVEMFLDEARLASRMNHPNVVGIFDVGVEQGRYFIAMELVRGASLAALLDALGRSGRLLSASALAYLGRGLAEGLHHAHEQRDAQGQPLNLVHRDVSPQNLLVSVDGAVKLTDFGIAKARDSSSATAPGFVRGKADYFAPEQALGRKIDRRTDVFAAGVTLVHAATLQSPFRRESGSATAQAVVTEPTPDLRALRPELPGPLVGALERALEKDPDQRFATARELRDALPLPSTDAAAELAALVAELVPEAVRSLERGSAQTLAAATGTDELVEGGAAEPTTVERPARRSHWAWVGAGAAALAAVVVATALLLLSAPVGGERGDAVSAPPLARIAPHPNPLPRGERGPLRLPRRFPLPLLLLRRLLLLRLPGRLRPAAPAGSPSMRRLGRTSKSTARASARRPSPATRCRRARSPSSWRAPPRTSRPGGRCASIAAVARR
ncbi:MAG: serine/threonine protein kinase [Archangiaceae bacterium]|nr:serine/threonine protein kinase [Archangiaceae bacterium]